MKKFFLQLHERMGVLTILVIGLCMVSFGLLANSFALSQPVPKITFSSKKLSYTEKKPGSWNVEKSAEWIGEGKARITFQVDSTLMMNNKYTDVIFVLDISGSMSGEKLDRVKEDSKELVTSLLSDSHNQAALITFDTESEVVSGFTNKKDELIEKIDQLTDKGNTNYYQPLILVDSLLKNYQKRTDTGCIVLFLTDGYPNEDVPNQIGEYQYLKSTYPWLKIHGVQYEMGEDILNPIKEISDSQFIADMNTLNNVLFDASVVPIPYESFILTDFINNTYFNLDNVSQIKASFGTAKLTQENGVPKVTWNLSGLMSGRSATLTIDIDLKEEYFNQGGIYPTNKSSEVTSKIENNEEHVTTKESPNLQTHYQVIYEGNAPTGCTVSGVPKATSHLVFSSVEKSEEVPVCEGYQFKRWMIVTEGVEKLNDDYFRMPEKDVTLRAEWGKMTISKSMSGTVYTKPIPKLQQVGYRYKENLWQYKDSITKIVISNEVDVPEGSTSDLTWDISDDNRGGVMGYLVPNNDGTNTYTAYIQGDGEIIPNEDSSYLFSEFSKLIAIEGLELLDTSQVTKMNYMFDECQQLTNLGDLSGWDTSQVTNMMGMFYNCRQLTNIGDLSGWNTSQVTYMSSMFYRCSSLTSLDVSHFVTNKVTYMDKMFQDCSSLISLDLSSWNTSQVTDMRYMFDNCQQLSNLGDLSNWNTSQVTNMRQMFCDCKILKGLEGLSNWDTAQVTDMAVMFEGCSSLTNLNLSEWNISKVEDMGSMFKKYGNSINGTKLNLSNWDFSRVRNIGNIFDEISVSELIMCNCQFRGFKSFSRLFYGASTKNMDLSNWNVSSVTDFSFMFSGCSNLTSLDLSGWDTSQVTNMSYMVNECSSLTSLDISNWNTSQVTDMRYMFGSCSSLTSLDLSNWNTSKVTDMSDMFDSCSSLISLDLSNWDTSQVTSMSYMFSRCSNLISLDLSSWNTSQVTDMSSMFAYCSSLTSLDLSSWNTSQVTDMNSMFYRCYSLTTTINILNPSLTSYYSMFYQAATEDNVKITVGYTSETSDLVDKVIATKSTNSHVEKVQIPEYSISVVGNSDIQTDVQKAYASRIVTLSSISGNYVVTSFKMNGTLIQGNTFTMPNTEVTITDITVVQPTVIESEHNPYPNSLNNKVYGEKTFAGAKSLTVVLEYQTEGINWDYIYLYDSTGKQYGKYGGKTQTTETITIPGEYIKIVFKTDSSGNSYYGFKATITPNF